MKKFTLAIALLCSLACFAGEEEQLFEKGNALYQKSDWKGAIEQYEKALSSGKVSAELYFNLGNAYYKSGNNAFAILNYERALKITPEDEDIHFNLRMANMKVIDKISPLPEFFLTRWWNNLVRSMSSHDWSKLTIAFSFFISFMIIAFVLSRSYTIKRMAFFLSIAGIILLIASFIVSSEAYKHETKDTYAILFQNSAYVKGSPDEKGTDLFILHEGIKMKVIDQLGEWRRIRLADGNEGWVRQGDLKII